MTEAWKSIKLKGVEHVVTGPGESLLRVGGKAPRRGDAGPRPTLVIEGSTAEHRFAPLRAPVDRRGLLRAAYAVPTALVQSGARCWLEFSDGTRADLPVPEEAARVRDDHRPAPAPEPPTVAAYARAQSAERQAQTVEGRAQAAEAQLESLAARAEAARNEAATATARVAALQQRVAELEQAARADAERITTLEHDLAEVAPARKALEREMDKLRSRRANLEHELSRSRDQLRSMTFERDELSRQVAAFDAVAIKARDRAAQAEAANEKAGAALRELQVWRGELERRLAETTTELGATRAAREADERELMGLRARLAEVSRHSSEAPQTHQA